MSGPTAPGRCVIVCWPFKAHCAWDTETFARIEVHGAERDFESLTVVGSLDLPQLAAWIGVLTAVREAAVSS
ncbi:hypothetical protein ACQP2P_01650 [Dactylosporangium sp. CA-139114]|uniref:hypothetical protein n=1 Tax=Dactylosporangium sp. CA-139114 TaxID=3239931 RepID=UPI003D99476C